jgi:hypothetical protein
MPDLIVRTCTQYWVFLHNNCSKLHLLAHVHTSQRRQKESQTRTSCLGWPLCLTQLPALRLPMSSRSRTFVALSVMHLLREKRSAFRSGERGGHKQCDPHGPSMCPKDDRSTNCIHDIVKSRSRRHRAHITCICGN